MQQARHTLSCLILIVLAIAALPSRPVMGAGPSERPKAAATPRQPASFAPTRADRAAEAVQAEKAAPSAQPITMRSARAPGALDRVEVKLEVSGTLVPASQGKVEKLRMSEEGIAQYDEKTLEASPDPGGVLRSVRYYDKAETTIKVGAGDNRLTLRDQRRLIVAQYQPSSATKLLVFSPHGTLTGEECDLADMTTTSLVVERLLPDGAVAVGDHWKHPDSVMAAILGLDRVEDNDSRSVVASVQDHMARMELECKVKGIDHGRPTVIEVKGKYRFDLKLNRITWLGMAIRQTQDRGPISHGLEALARYQILVEPIEQSPHLADSALKDLPLTPTEAVTDIHYESQDGGWQITHDRRWEVTTQQAETATLRLAGDADTLAHLRISALPASSKTEQSVSLTDFQADIQRVLGKGFGQFVEAGQMANQADYREYRVVIQGKLGDRPVRWIYYMLADKTGRRVVFAFNLAEESLEKFGHADRKLVHSFRFTDRKVAAKAP